MHRRDSASDAARHDRRHMDAVEAMLMPPISQAISVRELAYTPPPPPSPSFMGGVTRMMNALPFTRTGQQSEMGSRESTTPLRAPAAPVIYATTSAQLLTPRGEPRWADVAPHGDDFAALASRSIAHMSYEELFDYTSNLQSDAKSFGSRLAQAHHRCQEYRAEVANLKERLQEQNMKLTTRERENDQCNDVICNLRENIAILRAALERVTEEKSRLSERLEASEKNNSKLTMEYYQQELRAKEILIQEWRSQSDELAAELKLLREAQAAQFDSPPRSAAHTSESYYTAGNNNNNNHHDDSSDSASDNSGSRAEAEAACGEARDAGTEHHVDPATTAKIIQDLQIQNASLQLQLENALQAAAAAVPAPLPESTSSDDSDLVEAERRLAELQNELTAKQCEIVTLTQRCSTLQEEVDRLSECLHQRAPVSQADYDTFRKEYAEMKSQLAEAQDALEESHARMTTLEAVSMQAKALEDRCHTLTSDKEDLLSLLNTEKEHSATLQQRCAQYEEELKVSARANELRQHEIDELKQAMNAEKATEIQYHDAVTASDVSSQNSGIDVQTAEREEATEDRQRASTTVLQHQIDILLDQNRTLMLQLEEARTNTSEALEQMAAQLVAEQERTTQLSAELDEACAQREAQAQQLEEAQSESRMYADKAAELSETVSQLNSRLSESADLLSKVEDMLKEREATLVLAVREVEHKSVELDESQQKVCELEERLAAAMRSLEQTVELYNNNIEEDDKLRDYISSLKAELNTRTGQVAEVRAHFASALVLITDVFERLFAKERQVQSEEGGCEVAKYDWEPYMGEYRECVQPLVSTIRRVSRVASEAVRSSKLENSLDGTPCDHTLVDASMAVNSSESVAVSVSNGKDEPWPAEAQVRPLIRVLCRLAARHDATLTELRTVSHQLREQQARCVLLQAAVDSLAVDKLDEQGRADELYAAITEVTTRLVRTQNAFEDQLQQRAEAVTAELLDAQRAERRANEALRRAEEQLKFAEEELVKERAAKQELTRQNRELERETARLTRLTSGAAASSGALSSTVMSVAGTAGEGEGRRTVSRRGRTSSSPARSAVSADELQRVLETAEQAQMLQISSLQTEILFCRKQVRESELREAKLQQTNRMQDQTLQALTASAEAADALRADNVRLTEENQALQERVDELTEWVSAAEEGASVVAEVQALRQRVHLLESELEEEQRKVQELMVAQSGPGLSAARRQEAVRESLSGLTTLLTAAQAQYARQSTSHIGPTATNTNNVVTRSERTTMGEAESSETRGADATRQSSLVRPSTAGGSAHLQLLQARIEYLENALQSREEQAERLAQERLQKQARLELLEDNLQTNKKELARLEQLNTQYAATIENLSKRTPRLNDDHSSIASYAATPAVVELNAITSQHDNVLYQSNDNGSVELVQLAQPSPVPRLPGTVKADKRNEANTVNTPPRPTPRRWTTQTSRTRSTTKRRSQKRTRSD